MTTRPGPALVTGANSGFGLATVLRLASRGWDTWGTVRSESKAKLLTDAAKKADVADRVHPVLLDVSDHDAITKKMPELPDFYAVVNNAGYSALGAIEEVSATEAKAQLDVNLVAPAIVSACALPGMRRLGGGRIVMVSSVAGLASVMPLNGWYHASKFGLEALSDVLRMEVSGFGVKVSIVEPGFFKTGITANAQHAAEERGDDGSIYAPAYERAAQILTAITQLSLPAELVSRRIVTAVEARSPARRYLVGLDAYASVLANTWVPRGIIDMTARYLTRLDSVRATPSAEA